jgi:hypothetical protein
MSGDISSGKNGVIQPTIGSAPCRVNYPEAGLTFSEDDPYAAPCAEGKLAAKQLSTKADASNEGTPLEELWRKVSTGDSDIELLVQRSTLAK